MIHSNLGGGLTVVIRQIRNIIQEFLHLNEPGGHFRFLSCIPVSRHTPDLPSTISSSSGGRATHRSRCRERGSESQIPSHCCYCRRRGNASPAQCRHCLQSTCHSNNRLSLDMTPTDRSIEDSEYADHGNAATRLWPAKRYRVGSICSSTLQGHATSARDYSRGVTRKSSPTLSKRFRLAVC
ncbi:hypothetical protein Mapa_000746 [Marchantia paleacea]|nr:hypothetical protein Mapa_000746 [Marchantia paleacea]